MKGGFNPYKRFSRKRSRTYKKGQGKKTTRKKLKYGGSKSRSRLRRR